MERHTNLFRCAVRGKTTAEREDAAHAEARNHYGGDSFYLVRASSPREIPVPGSWQPETYEAEFLFSDGRREG